MELKGQGVRKLFKYFSSLLLHQPPLRDPKSKTSTFCLIKTQLIVLTKRKNSNMFQFQGIISQ